MMSSYSQTNLCANVATGFRSVVMQWGICRENFLNILVDDYE